METAPHKHFTICIFLMYPLLSLKLYITTPDINTKYDNVTTSKVGDFIEDYISNPKDTNLNFKNIHLGQSTII